MQRILYTFSLAILICIVSTKFILAQNSYYLDSQNGKDCNDGLSEYSAWKSHSKVESINLQPGDAVYFKRGSAWVGGIQIDASGTEGNPIVFTNYGSGELPKFSNPSWSDNTGNALRFNGDYLVADGLYFHDVPPPPKGGFLTVWSAGALRILLGNKYWGPIGIQLGIGNQEISYNTIRDFWVTEGHAWGGDGGAIEMDDGRNHKNNVYIHHNRTSDNCGFLEISWDYDIEHMEVWNLRVAFNLSSDYQSIGFLEAPLHDSYIDNNTFDRTRQLHYNSAMEVQLGNPIVRNNLIILAGSYPYPSDENPSSSESKWSSTKSN